MYSERLTCHLKSAILTTVSKEVRDAYWQFGMGMPKLYRCNGYVIVTWELLSVGEKQFFFSYTVILLQAAYSFHRKGHSYDSRLGIWVKTYQIPHNFLITWPAIRRPATGGTKETLPGMERFEEERASWDGAGFRGSSREYSTSRPGMPIFFSSFLITRQSGQTEVW